MGLILITMLKTIKYIKLKFKIMEAKNGSKSRQILRICSRHSKGMG